MRNVDRLRWGVWLRLLAGLGAALGLGAVVLLSGLREGARLRAAEARFSGQAIAAGASLYGAHCAGCHGAAGGGIAEVAPALKGEAFFVERMTELGYQADLATYVRSTIAAGRPVRNEDFASVMPAWAADYGGPLRPDQVEALTAFILNWRIAPAVAAVSTSGSGAAAAQGKALFGARDCIGCHDWPGRGGITGPDLAGVAARGATEQAGFDAAAYLRASILAPSAHVVAECPTGPCPDMMPRDYGAQLSPREIELAVQYLLTLTEAAPPLPAGAPPPLVGGLATPGPVNATPASPRARGQALYAAHCAACHGEQGQGGLGSQLAPGQASIDRLRYVQAALAQGTPGMMPAWDQAHGGPLSEIDLNDLADFVVNRLGQP